MEKNNFSNSALTKLNSRLNKEITSVEEFSKSGMENMEEKLKDGKTTEELLQFYEEKMSTGEVITHLFDSCDTEGNFTSYKNGVTVYLDHSNLLAMGKDLSIYATSKLLGVPLKLRVSNVSREERYVKLCIPKANAKDGEVDMRFVVHAEISRALKAGHHPILWCKVTKVTENLVFVDILNIGVPGMVNKANWQAGYTPSLPNAVKEGEFYKLEVLKKRKRDKKAPIWVLSRKSLVENPWEVVNLDGLEEGGNIIVKCENKPEGKAYWWGVSERVPGILIMCDYSSSCAKNTIIEGLRYTCKIKQVSFNKESGKPGRFSVIPFGIYKEDLAKAEAFKKLRSERMAGGISEYEDN